MSNQALSYVIGPILCYLLGSFPVAFLFVKFFKGIDIRKIGSGNVGATNASRAFERRYRPWVLATVFVFDILKGLASVALIFTLLRNRHDPEALQVLYGLCAIVGHIWPVYLSFKGGKGVATTTGVLIVVAPYAIMIAAIAWLLTFLLTKYVSLGSVIAAVCLSIGFIVKQILERQDPFGGVLAFTTGFCLLVSAIIVLKHRTNIRRLMSGTESRFDEEA